MMTEQVWQWRIQGVRGRWRTTRWHATEENIKVQNPEAVRVAGSMLVRKLPDPDEPWQDLYPRGVLDYGKGMRDTPNPTQAGQVPVKPKP